MAASTVRVRGYRETARAFHRMSGALEPTLRAGLLEAAEPVAREAKSLLSQYAGAKTETVAPRVTTRGVYVTQRARKKTGLRADFGALQMVTAFIPALEHHVDEVEAGAERALTAIERLGGF
jgi:hypothetical protein